MRLQDFLSPLPLVAILRGVRPEEVVAVGEALLAEGFRVVEVPLNSPEPVESIRRLAAALGDRALVGAGTATTPDQVREVAEAGGKLIVMPHGDPAVISAAKAHGMLCTPGVATPTEGFAALAAGADALKLFPAEMLGPPVLKAMRSVFPKGTMFLPVGGVSPTTMTPFVEAGATGFGLGSALYKPGASAEEVGRNARAFARAWAEIESKRHAA